MTTQGSGGPTEYVRFQAVTPNERGHFTGVFGLVNRLGRAGRVFNCWGFGLGILTDATYQSVRASVGDFVPLPAMV